MRITSTILVVTATVVMTACAAPAPPPTPAVAPVSTPTTVSETDRDVIATVVDVDVETRLLTLRRADGSIEKIYAPAEVKNLPQVEIGDQVVVTYVAALTAAKTTTAGPPTTVVDQAVATAPEGSIPGAAAGRSATAVVTVDGYDPATHIVTFTGPKGVRRTAEIQRPEMQALATGLKKGDLVQVTLSEAAAITIEPPAP